MIIICVKEAKCSGTKHFLKMIPEEHEELLDCKMIKINSINYIINIKLIAKNIGYDIYQFIFSLNYSSKSFNPLMIF